MSPVLALTSYFTEGWGGCTIEVRSYSGGSIATSRINQFEQISAEKPDKKISHNEKIRRNPSAFVSLPREPHPEI